MLDLSQNFNGLGPPQAYTTFIKKSFDNLISNYAGDNYGVIKMDEVEDSLGVERGTSLLTLGATQAIQLISDNNSEECVITLKPTFWEYKHFNVDKLAINEIDIISNDPLDKLQSKLVQEKSSLVFICNPNNPTGRLFEKKYLHDLIRTNKKHIFVVDETYLHFSGSHSGNTLSNLTQQYDNLYVIQSFSKIFAIPGLRIGIVLSSKENIQKIKADMTPYSISPIQIESCKYLLKYENEYLQRTKEDVSKNKLRITKKLSQNRISFFDTDTNFIFLKPKNQDFKKVFFENNVNVRYGEEFGDEYKDFVRLKLWDHVHDGKVFDAIH